MQAPLIDGARGGGPRGLRSKRSSAFTLVEIMIVVVIIGLLAAMAVFAFTRVRQQSRVSSVENFVRQVSGAAEQYMMEYGASTVDYTQLAGAENYLKGDPLADLGAFMNLSYNGVAVTGDFSISSNQAYVFDFAGGGSISGEW